MGGSKHRKTTSATTSTTPSVPTTGPRYHGNDTSGSTGRSGRQNAATRRNMRREERVTVQGPVKEQQPDGMSHGGGGCPKILWCNSMFERRGHVVQRSGSPCHISPPDCGRLTIGAKAPSWPRTLSHAPPRARAPPLHNPRLIGRAMGRRTRRRAGQGGVRCSADTPGAARPKAGLRGAVGVMPLTTGLAWESLQSARVTPLLWATAIRKWVCPASVDSLIH